jgi:hypothetical protein
LDLIPLLFCSLRRHIKTIHRFLMSLTPITFDSNKVSRYGGSYYETIVVLSNCRRPLNFIGHQFLQVIHTSIQILFSNQNCYLPFFDAPEGAEDIYFINNMQFSSFHLWFHDMSMGPVCLVCTHIYMLVFREYLIPFPSNESLL